MLQNKDYNPVHWTIALFLIFKTSVFKKLWLLLSFLIIYAFFVVWFEHHYGIAKKFNLDQFHLIFNFVLGLLVVFRINSAYSRWWEARILWGSLVNNMRNLALKFESYIGLDNDYEFFILSQYLPLVLHYHLLRKYDQAKQVLEGKVNGNLLAQYDGKMPNFICLLMNKIINEYRINNAISFEQYVSLEKNLNNIIDIIGGCERIKNTPIPLTFGYFAKFGLFIYALVFPFGWSTSFGFLIIPFLIILVYTLLGLELIAEEMEDPFDGDQVDVRTFNISQIIAQDINDIRVLGQNYTP